MAVTTLKVEPGGYRPWVVRLMKGEPSVGGDRHEVRDGRLQVERGRGGHREDLPRPRVERDGGAGLAGEALLRRLLHPGVEAEAHVGAALLLEVEPLQERLGAEAAGQVAVVGRLDARLAVLLGEA